MTSTKRILQSKKKEIKYTFTDSGSDTVCFMFSGLGYTYDKPLFYYSTMLMLEKKIDVVQVNYSYQNEFIKQSPELITEAMLGDIEPIIDEVLKKHDYSQSLFLGKSLGTIPLVNGIMKNSRFSASKMILLTPLLKMDGMCESIAASNHNGILIIGDKDPHYDSNKLKQIQQTSLLVEVIANADHSLDVEKLNTIASISAMSRVIDNLRKIIE
ncbi:alpha/beta family hydrolase [Niallia sp. 03133]|uniref:alpha/beta family hydrolase n=1 Tax=Niallia sp. 03133 TaxID=3458060 RepID=UPI004043B93E